MRTWLSGVHFSGDIDVGATFNPEGPNTGINFGQLFTGKANQLVLNRFAVTMARPIGADPAAFDLGFRAQVAYGLDSQFIHFLGVGEHGSTGRNSIDMVEANVLAHAPLLTAGGIDLMAGFFTSPMGFEQIDPTGNFFYSNSYIFNFGTPRKHTGLLTTTHVTDWLDVYVGATTGVNTSFGPGGGDNDKTPHILGGVALKFDRLSIRALTHIGPEDPRSLVAGVPTAGGRTRFINDVVVSWGATDRLTTTTELNYVKDEGVRAAGGGVATYLTYALSPGFSAGVRAEVWRDAEGAFVAGYPGNLDYVNAEAGLPNGALRSGPTTYGALTLGLNIKGGALFPALGRTVDSPFGALIVRPEIRYDRALSGGTPFGDRPGGRRDQLTVGVDVIAPLELSRLPRDEADRAQPVINDQDNPGAGAPVARRPSLADGLAALRAAGNPAPDIGFQRPVALFPTWENESGFAPIADGPGTGWDYGQVITPLDRGGPRTALAGPEAEGIAGETAGLPTVDTTRPRGRWGVEAGYGLDQGYRANDQTVALDAPLRRGGIRLSASHAQRGGYLTNVYSGDGLYGRNELSAATVRFDATVAPGLEADAAATVTRQDGQGTPYALGDPLSARLQGLTAPTLGPFQTANDAADRHRVTAEAYSLSLTYNGSVGRVRSLTTWLDRGDLISEDLDGGCDSATEAACSIAANPQVGSLRRARRQSYRQFHQSLSLERSFGRRVTVLAGADYDWGHEAATDLTVGAAAPAGVSTVRQAGARSESGFVAVTARPLSGLRLSGALRYLDDRADGGAGFELARTHRVLSQARIDYTPLDGLGLYAERATGLRPGGASLASTLAEDQPGQTNFDPSRPQLDAAGYGAEQDTVYRIGGEAGVMDRTLTLRAAGFIIRQDDRQLAQSFLTPGYGPAVDIKVVNLPRTELRGVEGGLLYRPSFVPGLNFDIALRYQHARITDGRVPAVEAAATARALAGAPGKIVDLSGLVPPWTPAFAYQLGMDYAHDLGAGRVAVAVDYRWTSHYALALSDGQVDTQGPYGLLDASLSYSRSFYTLTVTGRNLLNAAVFDAASPALFTHRWADPRTAVLALKVRF